MLGEQIGEEAGKVMVRRVISVDGGAKVEVTVESTGRLLGIETRGNVTYCAEIRPDGSVFGEAQGLVVGQGGRAGHLQGPGRRQAPRRRRGQLSRRLVLLQRLREAQPAERGRHGLRVRGRRRREDEEQALGVEVGAGREGQRRSRDALITRKARRARSQAVPIAETLTLYRRRSPRRPMRQCMLVGTAAGCGKRAQETRRDALLLLWP